MKYHKCPKCNKKQASGKYCLDCGVPLIEVMDKNVRFAPIETMRDAGRLKSDIRKWLNRLGIPNTEIQINTEGISAGIDYSYNTKKYHFSSSLQANIQNNLAAIEQFLHSRVLSIEHGVETAENAFKGYEALPDFSKSSFDYFAGLRTEEEVKLRWKALSKTLHPDAGGSSSEFAKMQAQYEEVKKINGWA